ncbi:MAG TPA: type IV toxin-antitoxin system AbiEi family antitoxin domain-containing protein [Acidimicrobiia bacterium]|nr:type IV toxin-antitoxin system AbiEi family antitoxin domain-containing protein [Acidimicrobiia bacterium]
MNDAALLRLAGRQHGLVTVAQLIALGFSEKSIRHRVKVGMLFRVQRGVYGIAGAKDTFEFRVMAAVLAAGDGALASHRCAAALYGLRRIRCEAPEVTVCGRAAPRIDGLQAHGRGVLLAQDRTRIGLIPVTSPAWTLLDLAAGGTEWMRLGGALDDVLVRKLASLGAIDRLVARALPLRLPGARVLAELLEERRQGKKPSETGLEDELLEVFRAYGLPEPVTQYVLPLPGGGTARFDAAYPDLLLGFEADGDKWHKGLLDQMRDEARDEQCGLVGWTVRRYGTDDIRDRPAGIADEVERLRRNAEAA